MPFSLTLTHSPLRPILLNFFPWFLFLSTSIYVFGRDRVSLSQFSVPSSWWNVLSWPSGRG